MAMASQEYLGSVDSMGSAASMGASSNEVSPTSMASLDDLDEKEWAILAPEERLRKRFGVFATVQRTLARDEAFGRPAIHGVVTLKLRRLILDHPEFFPDDMGISALVAVRNQMKRTITVRHDRGVCEWNVVKHLPVTIPKNKRHAFNLVTIQFFTTSTRPVVRRDREADTSSIPSEESIKIEETEQMRERRKKQQEELNRLKPIGTVHFHVHDIIYARCVNDMWAVWDDQVKIGELELDASFHYGLMGYGFSDQFQETDYNFDDMITYSLFPRVIPSDESRDDMDIVALPTPVEHPACIPFRNKVTLSCAKEIEAFGDIIEQVFPSRPATGIPFPQRDEILAVRDEYCATTNRTTRLMLLHDFLNNRSRGTLAVRTKPRQINRHKVADEPAVHTMRLLSNMETGRSESYSDAIWESQMRGDGNSPMSLARITSNFFSQEWA